MAGIFLQKPPLKSSTHDPVAALLLAAATSQTADTVFTDGFEPYQCPATISTPTGTRTWRTYSDIFYLPNEGNIRHTVDLTRRRTSGVTSASSMARPSGRASPARARRSSRSGKHEYVGAKFHVPPDTLPNLSGWFKHVMYIGGPPIDFAISRICGDFQPVQGCYGHELPGQRQRDGALAHEGTAHTLPLRVCCPTPITTSISASRIRTSTGPNCSGSTCYSTIQNYSRLLIERPDPRGSRRALMVRVAPSLRRCLRCGPHDERARRSGAVNAKCAQMPEPHQGPHDNAARGRIELREIAPHAAVLVPGDEQRPVPARCALRMHGAQRPAIATA